MLPSKNFVVTIFAAIVILFVGWFVIYIATSYQLLATSQKLGAGSGQLGFLEALEDANRDSDNDGLKDWEEILWKTDPNRPDTDGDGTPDAEEVKLGRDPISAGPNDKLKKPEEKSKTATTTPGTLTDKIAQEFAAKYLTAAGTAEGELDIFQKKTIAESLIESLSRDALLYKDKFSPADVKVAQNPSYLKTASDFLNKTFAGLGDPELIILDRVLSAEKYEDLKKLDGYIAAYQKTVDFLKKQNVPENYAALHLELMNIMQNTAVADSFMRVVDKDPARGLMGLELYAKQAERLQKFYNSGGDKLFKNPGS